MADVTQLLDKATPLPWSSRTYGHRSIRAAAGQVARDLSRPPVDPEVRATMTDLTYIEADEDGPRIALTGNGPKQTANAALIVYAVNHLPDYEALADAVETLLGDEHPSADAPTGCSCEPVRAALARLRDVIPSGVGSND